MSARLKWGGGSVLLAAVVATILAASSGTGLISCSQVAYSSPSGANITYDLLAEYHCGQFANGDWFVVPNSPGGSVVISSITPTQTGTGGSARNGAWINPTSTVYNAAQRFDGRLQNYGGSQPSFPLSVDGDSSVVKIASRGTCSSYSCTQFAAVLTVLDDAPENPSETMRPPYIGTYKPLISAVDLQMDLLPRLDSDCCAHKITRATAIARSAYLRLNYHPSPTDGYFLASSDAADDGKTWGGDWWKSDSELLSWLILNNACDSSPCTEEQDTAAKRPVAIDYAQNGIDLWGAVRTGSGGGEGFYRGGGANGAGMLMPVVFAATILDNMEIRDWLSDDVTSRYQFFETGSYYLNGSGVALWGQIPTNEDQETTYWSEFGQNDTGNKTIRDPYEQIDGGGIPGTSYQSNTSAQAEYQAVILEQVPELFADWPTAFDNAMAIKEYGERWATHGTLTAPDTCASKGSSYGVDYGPNGSGGCVLGSGRALDLDGNDMNGGNRNSEFGDEMWDAFGDAD